MASVSSEFTNTLSMANAAAAPEKQSRVLPLIVVVLLASFIVPFLIHVGPLRLSIYRIVLILAFIPVVVAWLSGQAGRVRLADIAYLMYCVWAMLSFTVNHGAAGLQAGGMVFFETFGAYLVARVFIRSAEAFQKMVKVLFVVVLCLLPFAAIEAVLERNLILNIAGQVKAPFIDVPSFVVKEPRLGMQRVQGPFEHPILFGVFCGSAVALTFLVLGYGRSFIKRITQTGAILLTGFFSLSAGPLAGMFAQIGLLGWNWILRSLRSRWKILFLLFVTMWVGLEIVANRPAAQIIFLNFSFNQHNAMMRMHIWNFGTDNIIANPLFGLGFRDWARPFWLTSSVDMYWILGGMRHGIPAVVFTFVGFFAVLLPLIFRKGLDATQDACRLAIVCCLLGFFVTGWTVHYWNATYVLLHFLLGSGMWLLDASAKSGDDEGEAATTATARQMHYRRGQGAGMPTTRFTPSRRRA